MRRWIIGIGMLSVLLLAGCSRYQGSLEGDRNSQVVAEEGRGQAQESAEAEEAAGSLQEEGPRGQDSREAGRTVTDKGDSDEQNPDEQAPEEQEQAAPERIPVKVKGIYVSAYVAGSEAAMEKILGQLDATELNAVVIDVKDDNGRVTFRMDSPMVGETGACTEYIPDIRKLTGILKEHGIYCIARIPAFRDPYLAEAKPEWCLKLADGSIYRDKNNLAWVNPYKKEVWEYLLEIAEEAGRAGFDEIQFDYIRFCTEKGMDQVVFDEADTEGKSRQEIILEFTSYASGRLREKGLFVSADVFGAVIHSGADGQAVGQDYRKMAENLDYICPMVYPSHYGAGNFGIASPDTQPYKTVLGALTASREVLSSDERDEREKEAVPGVLEEREGQDAPQAAVRPWLQDFTASYLPRYIPYGPKEVREQIQAVYDAGYEEWILWSAAVNYHYEGLLSPQEAQAYEEYRENGQNTETG